MSTQVTNILIPGRHHLITNFMAQYLYELLRNDGKVLAVDGEPVTLSPAPNLVWAVTSANHSGTRRNPLPGHRREVAIEHLRLTPNSFTFLIDDLGPTRRFADYVIKEIDVQSLGHLRLDPSNTIVAVSTPAVIRMYQALGYRILPLELADLATECFRAKTAWECVIAVARAGAKWRDDETYRKLVHPASQYVFEKYRLGDAVVEVHSDPIAGNDGDLTDTRDYETYRQSFIKGAERKYALVKGHIVPGRIVDIGCATGAIMGLMSRDPRLSESDLYGVELARPLYEFCEEQKRKGYFGNPNVFFYQRNIMRGRLFQSDTVTTTTTFALTHEIESYVGHDGLLEFIDRVYEQTARGGVWINSDVVGPEDGDRLVLMECRDDDGENPDPAPAGQATPEFLARLSTAALFRQFAQDFRAHEGDGLRYEEVEKDGRKYFRLRLADAADFASKKDYHDSWYSEMHERFCYWSFTQWKQAVEAAGFTVKEASHAYRNEWIVENRWAGTFRLLANDTLEELPYPVTSMVLIAEKLT